MNSTDTIIEKITTKDATIGVIGLGYVARPPACQSAAAGRPAFRELRRGLPLLLCFVEKGFFV